MLCVVSGQSGRNALLIDKSTGVLRSGKSYLLNHVGRNFRFVGRFQFLVRHRASLYSWRQGLSEDGKLSIRARRGCIFTIQRDLAGAVGVRPVQPVSRMVVIRTMPLYCRSSANCRLYRQKRDKYDSSQAYSSGGWPASAGTSVMRNILA